MRSQAASSRAGARGAHPIVAMDFESIDSRTVFKFTLCVRRRPAKAALSGDRENDRSRMGICGCLPALYQAMSSLMPQPARAFFEK